MTGTTDNLETTLKAAKNVEKKLITDISILVNSLEKNDVFTKTFPKTNSLILRKVILQWDQNRTMMRYKSWKKD